MSISLALKLHRLGSPRILVVGDQILDVDLHGRCDRFAAESAGCPVFTVEKTVKRPGGACAVWSMANALGADAAIVAHPAAVSVKTRHFVNGVLRWRHDADAKPLTAEQSRIMADAVQDEAAGADGVLVADYGKGSCTADVLNEAIGDRCIVDPHGNANLHRYCGAEAFKCNRSEARSIGKSGPRFDWEPDALVVTDGPAGMLLDLADGGQETFPARPRNVVDVTGAGDMVLAALGACVFGGLSWSDACRVANAAAGLKVERHGASPVSRCEVVVDLLDGAKGVPAELLGDVAATARIRGRKVAWCNGCFDRLHPGHLHFLTEAKLHGDVLIVALNSDASVRRLKGDGRPLLPQKERAAMLAALACVDYVVGFDTEDELDEMVMAVRPNVFVTGSEYRGRRVTGLAHAHDVFFVDRLPGHSTTALAS